MRRRRLRRYLVLGWILCVIVSGIAVNAYIALRPAALEARLRQSLSEALACPFELSSFVLGWNGNAEITDLRLYRGTRPHAVVGGLGAPGAELVSIASLRIVPRLTSLFRGSFEVKRIEILSPLVRLAADADGSLGLKDILSEALLARRTSADLGAPDLDTVPTIIIENGKLVYADNQDDAEPAAHSAEEIYAILHREENGPLRFKGELRTQFARRIELRGSVEWDSDTPVVRTDITVSKLDLSLPLAKFFPASVAADLKQLELQGFVDLVGSFRYDRQGGLTPITLTADVLRAELNPPHSPYPLRGLKGRARLTERGLVVEELTGTMGSGRVSLNGKLDLARGWFASTSGLELSAWSLHLRVDACRLDQNLREALPLPVQAALNEANLSGVFGLEATVRDCRVFPPGAADISARVRLQGMEASYAKFPYPLHDLTGEIRIEKGRVVFDGPIVARQGQVIATVSGRGAALSPHGDIEVIIDCQNVPIDERFRAALPREIHQLWDDFQLAGAGGGTVIIARDAVENPLPGPDGKLPPIRNPHVIIHARPDGLRMSYRGFPYEIKGLKGGVVVDLRRDTVTIDKLMGHHGDHAIEGEAFVDFAPHHADVTKPVRFKIGIKSPDVVVDRDLIAALSQDSQKLVEDFNFGGRARVDVSVHSNEQGAVEVTGDVEIHQASVRYKLFPYELPLARGRLKILPRGALIFEDVATPAGSKPHVTFGGDLTSKDGFRTLGFNFDVAGLTFDNKLVDALPSFLQSFVVNLKLAGSYDGRVTGSYSFNEANPELFKIIYKGEKIRSQDAAVDFGLRIHQMAAEGSFLGSMESGMPHKLLGEVKVASAWFNRLHLTNGEIDFALGKEHPVLQLVRDGGSLPGRDYLPPAAYAARLAGDKSREVFELLVHSPDLYGGQMDGFLFVESTGAREIGGDFVGKGFEIAKAAEDIFGTKGAGSSGTARGKVRFQGSQGDVSRLTGSGEGAIEKARLVELPLFLGLLSLIFGEASSRHYFNEVLLKYDIADGKFKAPSDGIDIRSTGIKLLGGGVMDFAGNLDFTLEPRVLDFKIPIVEQIFSVIKKGLAQVKISGSLSSPDVRFATAGGIVNIGIDPGAKTPPSPLPRDLRNGLETKDLPPGPK